MRTFTPVLLVATVAAVASAQSSSGSSTTASLSSASGSSSLSAELAAIVECNTTQLNEAQTILTSNQREAQCESALSLQSGTMLQVTTADATQMCDTASCKAALKELYNVLPNCRYNLWGLQYSAKKLLGYCGISSPTNTTDSSSGSSSGSVGWTVTSSSASFAAPGATDAPSTASSTTAASSASAGSSAATTTATVSAALAATAGLVAAYLA
ncbi:hypothetical protein PHYPSEUDO_002472 [Phytophthora pseudosyringae]|uniref:Elicitin n=1 Tax=Phytophthora pseudosyringae TaxID=221518 RepID=A0A8T1VT11_9STRA|nr:hypothetical protein PHYPSEUDO_002472 [Phytophthora pseudosyringae]